LKIWKLARDSKKQQIPATLTEEATLSSPEPAIVEIPETFKEHYGLLPPFSHAAIVEDEKKEVKYSLLEPTLTELDKKWLKEIKSILWDELSISTKSFEGRQKTEDFLKYKIVLPIFFWEHLRKWIYL